MPKFLLTRLSLLLPLLAVANFGGYAYAWLARTSMGNPFFATTNASDSLWPAYMDYLTNLLRHGWAALPTMSERGMGGALAASGGLLLAAVMVSIGLGVLFALLGTRSRPPGIRGWLTAFTTLGLATPSFFIGVLVIALLLRGLIQGFFTAFPVPLNGFGWDVHLLLPILALSLRPTAQIAQLLAGRLAEEMGRPYVTTARSKGLRSRTQLLGHVMPNVWASLAQIIAGCVRLLVGELILVEKLFDWPGLGQLVANTLVPAQFASARIAATFLDPPLVATLLTLFAAVLLVLDGGAALLSRTADPRLRETTP
ncbi:MAG: ABC transporter permease subunit [Caldilineaceae bacterium]|nr:ABC transporter permease subunit [Caldilineaceae bacterium]MBP8107620.1 ABC transporter permease subunit [Caldilineaceae bacterium]MBP8125648.1 ABC transporter permease subunit [Caldilineaceae bacterium]MBP9072501.1 ABC transporter permease subunit [Caldilineaceae bacterium]